jgi:hypothetical protein
MTTLAILKVHLTGCSLNLMVSLVQYPLHVMIEGSHTLHHAMVRETMNIYYINTLSRKGPP